MTLTDGFRAPEAVRHLVGQVRALATRPVRLVEFCGGHTHAIMRYGLRAALAPQIRLLSGPGCPVCVTDDRDIDRAIALAQLPGVTVTTFGDMLRVPGTQGSLQQARARGADVRVVYSALDALTLAEQAPEQTVVMLGIGFETTAPTIAAALVEAQRKRLANFLVYSLHKRTPPATRAILDTGETQLDGVIGPGHVTAVIGWEAWRFLPEDYRIPCAVAGFEPVDILQAIAELARMVVAGTPAVANTYARGVTAAGNAVAQRLLDEVFQPCDAAWRGLGVIPASGLELAPAFAAHNARLRLEIPEAAGSGPDALARGCRCGDVLRGVLEPPQCPLFGRACTPARPVGPCMVSGEGACAAHYRYRGESA